MTIAETMAIVYTIVIARALSDIALALSLAGYHRPWKVLGYYPSSKLYIY